MIKKNLRKRWPKYCIRLNSFQDYMKKKYPTLYEQNFLYREKSQVKSSDLTAQNIEKSLNFKENVEKMMSKKHSEDENTRKDTAGSKDKKLLRRRQNLDSNSQQTSQLSVGKIDGQKSAMSKKKNTVPVGLEVSFSSIML